MTRLDIDTSFTFFFARCCRNIFLSTLHIEEASSTAKKERTATMTQQKKIKSLKRGKCKAAFTCRRWFSSQRLIPWNHLRE